MGGGLESRCVGRVYGEDGAVHGTIGYQRMPHNIPEDGKTQKHDH